MRYATWLFLPLWAGFGLPAQAQPLTAVATRFNNSFQEWTIDREGESYAGELRRRWQTTDDWTAWDYRIGEHTGQIRLKWNGNPNEWEIRGDNEIVTARTVWNNDFRNWRITDGRKTITVRTRYNNLQEDWETDERSDGYFRMYTAYQGDPREWGIVDELPPETPIPLKMALVFIVLFHSTPKS